MKADPVDVGSEASSKGASVLSDRSEQRSLLAQDPAARRVAAPSRGRKLVGQHVVPGLHEIDDVADSGVVERVECTRVVEP